MIRRLLIANRGEIALRLIRTCRRLGIYSIAVYSDTDRDMPFVRAADTAVALGGLQASDTYLNADKLLQAAARTGADALHPGYGFLAENAEFARRCAQAGLIFVGPHPEAIEAMGSKSRAKDLMQQYGVPVVPGYRGERQEPEFLAERAREIGFPLLIKAAAGGGGKGMKIVESPEQLPERLRAARSEALNAFGDGELLLERYFPRARHVEFQIFGDRLGNAVHLFERECSLQRRYQKIMEESPSPALSPELRQAMAQAALQAARALRYDNAGTVEFILTPDNAFYFLEVNTRLQVEHPVTEAVTGLDLVEWQIRAAEGKPLPLTQEQIGSQGYALELRLYAEDPSKQFFPQTGTVLQWEFPAEEGLRCDGGVCSGNRIDVYFDPMLAKIIAHAPDRAQAFRRMEYALDRLVCLGPTTNREFLMALLRQEAVKRGDYDTHFITERFDWQLLQAMYEPSAVLQAALALLLYRRMRSVEQTALLPNLLPGWRNNPYAPEQESYLPEGGEQALLLRFEQTSARSLKVFAGGQTHALECVELLPQGLRLVLDGLHLEARIAEDGQHCFVQFPGNGSAAFRFALVERLPQAQNQNVQAGYQAPMPGEIRQILVCPGQSVRQGDVLLVLLSMKMENAVCAHQDGTVASVLVQEGQTVAAGTPLLEMH